MDGPSDESNCRSGRRVSSLWTVQFHPFGPFSFIPLDRPVLALCTVYFYPLRPSKFIYSDRTVFFLWTIHFWISRPSIFADRLLDCPVSVVWTVQFIPVGPFTLILGRPLYTWPPNQIFSLKTLTQLICKKIKCYNWSFEKGTEDSGPSSPS